MNHTVSNLPRRSTDHQRDVLGTLSRSQTAAREGVVDLMGSDGFATTRIAKEIGVSLATFNGTRPTSPPPAKRVAYAIVDVVTRYWIGYLLTSESHLDPDVAAVRPRAGRPALLAPMGCPASH